MAEAGASQAPLAPVDNSVPLRYADPRSLPSYPSSGLRSDGAAAGAATSLAWNNQKKVEIWKPNKLPAASAAAVLAKDYKMAPQWEPTPASDGHKAALLAVGSASSALKHQSSAPPPKSQHDGWGNSAATQAFHANRPAAAPTRDLSHGNSAATQAFIANRSASIRKAQATPPTPAQSDRPLDAAIGAMSTRRPRASTLPSEPRDHETPEAQSKRTANALGGAASAHRASLKAKQPVGDAGAVSVTTMTSNMFTSHPIFKPAVQEEQNNERIHQSAVEMARKMYSQQQKMIEQAKLAHPDEPEKHQPVYLNLQDAAYKQAQERLARLQDEHVQAREMQEYYGNSQAPRRRFTVTNKLRRKESDEELDDRRESEKIREQMSMFSTKLSEVDKTKRQADRDALMAVAQRNVKARLQGMDEKVSNDKGRVNSVHMNDWEVKAQQAAQNRHESRSENKGKVDVGGGMFMDPDEVNAIAAKRMQPVLDDINEKALVERERQAALKLEEENRREEVLKQKEREREIKDLQKRMKDEDKQDAKAKRMQEKEEAKAAKQRAKEEKRKSKQDATKDGIVVAGDDPEDARETPDLVHGDSVPATGEVHETSGAQAVDDRRSSRNSSSSSSRRYSDAREGDEVSTTPAAVVAADAPDTAVAPAVDEDSGSAADADRRDSTGGGPKAGVRRWISKRFSRRKSRGEHTEEPVEKAAGDKTDKSDKRRSFFRGGSALKKQNPNGSAVSLERSSSMRDVAMAGKTQTEEGPSETAGPETTVAGPSIEEPVRADSRGVSPVSSVEDLAAPTREKGTGTLTPPRKIQDPAPRSSISPSRAPRFREEIDEEDK